MSGEIVNDSGELLGTGPVLRAHIDELVAAGDGSDPTLNNFAVTMSRLLADRLGEYGVVPKGYVMVTTLLEYDCAKTGVNGFTGERMPREVTDMPPIIYGLFREQSISFAKGAFGEEFGAEVEAVYKKISEESSS